MAFVNYPRILQEDIRKLRESIAAKPEYLGSSDKIDAELHTRMKLKYSGTELAYLSALITKKDWQFARQTATSTNSRLPSRGREMGKPTLPRNGVVWQARSSLPHQNLTTRRAAPEPDKDFPYKTVEPHYSVPKRFRPVALKAVEAVHPRLPQAFSVSDKLLVHKDLTVLELEKTRRRHPKKPLDPNSAIARMRNYSQRVKDKFTPTVDSQKALEISFRLEPAVRFKPLRDIPKLKLFSTKSP